MNNPEEAVLFGESNGHSFSERNFVFLKAFHQISPNRMNVVLQIDLIVICLCVIFMAALNKEIIYAFGLVLSCGGSNKSDPSNGHHLLFPSEEVKPKSSCNKKMNYEAA